MSAALVNQVLGVLTIVVGVTAVLLGGLLLTRKLEAVTAFFGRHALALAFIVALAATVGSLTYSEILGYEPCKLCWFQRIFMYPLVILFGMAILRRDHTVTTYALPLSFIGAVIAGYHYLLQLGAVPSSFPCAAVGYSVSCAQRFVLQFGYITIPVMALSVFVLIATLCLAANRARATAVEHGGGGRTI